MHKNRLEKIIWEEISKTLNDLESDELKTVISSYRLTEALTTVKRSKKLYKLYKQRVQKYVQGGLMRQGEAEYFDSFVFPSLPPSRVGKSRVARGEDADTVRKQIFNNWRRRRAAARARDNDAPVWSPDARMARSGARPTGYYQSAWPTQPWGAAAVEKRIIEAGTKARSNMRIQFRQQGSVKNRDLNNADDVINDAFDDALTELAKGGNAAADNAVMAFKRRLASGFAKSKNSTRTTSDIIKQLGKSQGARDQLKKGANAQVKRTEERIAKIKKQVDDLKDEIKALQKKSDDIRANKPGKGASKAEKERIKSELKALEEQKNALSKNQGNREAALNKSKARLKKEKAEVSKIDNMSDEKAGEAWIKQNLQKGLDDIDDAVSKGADDFRYNRGAQAPASPAPRTARRATTRGASKFEVDAARVIERTPKPVKDALGDTLEAVNKDPAMLSKALQWVRTQSGATVQKLRDNPRAILGLTVSGVPTAAILISIFSDSTDDEGQGHKAASVDEAREGIAAMEQEMNQGLEGLEDRVADSPEKSEPGEVSLDQQIQNFEPIFDQGAKSYLEKAKNYIMGNSEVLGLINNFDPSAPVEKWSAKDGAIVLPKMVLYAIKASLVAAGAQMMVTGPNVNAKSLKSALDEYISIVIGSRQ